MSEGFIGALLAKAWPFFAALFGSITAAWFMRPKTRAEWVVTVAGGFVATVFVAPGFVAYWLPGVMADDPRVGAIYYLFSLAAMTAIPPFMRRVSKWVEHD